MRTGVKSSKSKLQDDTLKEATPEKAKPQDDALVSGGANKKRVNAYALFVKEVTQKQNMKNLADASKYIKEHNLYTKK